MPKQQELKTSFKNELARIAQQQITEGITAKLKRMDAISRYYDLYNNKTIEVGEVDVFNIPFPYLASTVDLFLSKIDNNPDVSFKIPNKPTLSEKIHAAWRQEMSSTRSGWSRKDRSEKKMALLSGRGIAKIYASSVKNQYKSHYDVVDIYSFIADPTRGFLEDGNYHGETNIFKTHAELQRMAKLGVYDEAQVKKLITMKETEEDGENEVVQNKFDRIKSLGVDVQAISFVGQTGVNMTEWIMRHKNEWFYLFLEPKTGIWARVEKLSTIFNNGKTPYVSWSTHSDEYAFWTKSVCDDVYPIAEAMRFLLNNALENEKRRTRPMRMVDSGALVDINELQDYVPDNVILRNPGRDPNVITVETPAASTTIDVVQYLDNLTQIKTGVQEAGIEESDTKVGIFFGRLQQEADRIGVINKEYSESYAHKGYRFFWGLKQHLTQPKQVEMLGRRGIKLQQLESIDFRDVDDVDDVIVSGGGKEKELSAIETEKQLRSIKELTQAYPDKINPTWVIQTTLKKAGFLDDDIEEALDTGGSVNRELMEEADQAIQEILLGGAPDLNHGADVNFVQRILDFARDELNYIKLNKSGEETGVDRKVKKQFDQLMEFVRAHETVVIKNMARKVRKQRFVNAGVAPQTGEAEQSVDIQGPTGEEAKLSLTQPFEAPSGTPTSTREVSQVVSRRLRP